jgi:hypothetical protein
MKITIPISVGELIDKITILQIKSNYINNEYVNKELKELKEIANTINYNSADESLLYGINRELWDVEDALRQKEKKQDFGYDFISLARSVYYLNDKRASIKRKINEETGSKYQEIKCYTI